MRSPIAVSKSLLAIVIVSIAVFSSPQAHAQYAGGVKIEGQVKYRLTPQGRPGRLVWNATAFVERLTNYDYEDHQGVKVILVISRKGYMPGVTLNGFTAASSSEGYLLARTSYGDINLRGRARIPAGKHRIVLAIINSQKRIIDAYNFAQVQSFRK